MLAETDASRLNRELRSKNISEYHETVDKAHTFLDERGNPYGAVTAAKLYHLTDCVT